MMKTISGQLKIVISSMIMFFAVNLSSMAVYAMDDGAYLVGRTTSYVNPDTGTTVDGGTNIALGESMCSSIVEDTILVEQYQGKTYVTMGIGLMSNISSVRVQVQSSDGSYREAELVQTGACVRNGDDCSHYRFKVESADFYISPVLYVDPMGRDVQFFVKLDMNNIQTGTGNYVSEMVPVQEEQPQATEEMPQTEEVPQSTEPETTMQEPETTMPETMSTEEKIKEEASSQKETAEEETTDSEKDTSEKHSGKKGWAAAIIILLAVGAGSGYWYYRKRKNSSI